MLHTTCVATRLNAGHANNALPQLAQANVNCRILPGHSVEEIRQALIKIFADPMVQERSEADGGTDRAGAHRACLGDADMLGRVGLLRQEQACLDGG